MKVAVFCNSDSLAIPSLQYLREKDMLVSVAIPAKNKSYLYPALKGILTMEHVVAIEKKMLKDQMRAWLLKYSPDVVWVFGCPWKIDDEVLKIPCCGFFNFHFGLLPKYAGADPVFWQLKNREKKSGLSIHRMTRDVDQGPLLHVEEIESIPGETYSMHCMRAGLIAAQHCGKIADKIENDVVLEIGDRRPCPYWKRPCHSQLSILWEKMDAEDIVALANASNPKYGGASTVLRGMEIRLLEVSMINVNGAGNIAPGTIVHADAVYGIIVVCRNGKYLRLNVIHMPEGYFSGSRLVEMGVGIGERLY